MMKSWDVSQTRTFQKCRQKITQGDKVPQAVTPLMLSRKWGFGYSFLQDAEFSEGKVS
jgi:hypothetical protein